MELVWRYHHAPHNLVCRCLHLHEDVLSTTVHGVRHDPMAPLLPSRRCVWRVAITLCFTFLYLLLLVLFSPVYFGILTICHRDDILCSFGQGTTSVLPFSRKGSVGVAPRCCFWVKFFYTVVVSLSRFIVDKCGPFEDAFFFQGLTDWDLLYKNLILYAVFPSGVIKCSCGTIATKLSHAAQRDSHGLCHFSLVAVPSRW